MQPAAIQKWATDVRAGTSGPFQINLWIPDPPPARDEAHEGAASVSSSLNGDQPSRPRPARQACPTSRRSAMPCWKRRRERFRR